MGEKRRTYRKNRGIQKICGCNKANWSKCKHAWHFNFRWKEVSHRFSLDAHLGKHVESKTDAEAEAERLRIAIRAGEFGRVVPAAEMTVWQLKDVYVAGYVKSARFTEERQNVFESALSLICRTSLQHPTRGPLPFGDFLVVDVVVGTVEEFQRTREQSGKGSAGTNRYLQFLRAMWSWAIKRGHAESHPFRHKGEVVVKLEKEHARTRRLEDGEEARLLAASAPHLHACVVAAIETGMRRGEILSLQWKQVEGLVVADDKTMAWQSRVCLFLPHEKTKTKRDRWIPISTRLRAVLEMRRLDPAGDPHGPDAYVFGTEVGTKVDGFKRAWHTAVLKAHDVKPEFTKTENLAPESRAAFTRINLRFHDLRREAGSRWLDGGVPIHVVRDWLGHANVVMTSTYLASTLTSSDAAMRLFEERSENLVNQGRKRRSEGTQSAGETDRKPQENAEGRDWAIN